MNNNVMSFIDTGEGFPVLLGHSYLFDKSMWTPQVDILSKNYRLIVPDLWGHGDSPSLPSGIKNLSDMAREYLRLMDYLGINEFAVIGLSVGGMWGAELAAMAPDRVRALMLMDTFLGSESAEEHQKYFQMLDIVENTGAITSPLLEYVVSQFYSDYALREDVEALTKYLASLPSSVLRTSIVPIGRMIFGRPDHMAILERIICPAHVAHGELDLPRPPCEGQEMAEKLGGEFTLIPKAGHISNREAPEFVTKMIADFLAKNLPL